MRGKAVRQVTMLSTTTPDDLVPADHPIRRIKPIVERALRELAPTFDVMYAKGGRPSIPPERLLKASLLIALYSIRSERQFCERLHYDMLCKWFLDMNIDEPAFDPTTFTKNRERLLAHEVAPQFFQAVVAQAKEHRLISAEHFTVDGTLLESWASLKSFRPNDPKDTTPRGGGGRNPEVDFRGQKRRNDTHSSTTDPEARLATKGSGQTAKLSFSGNVVMENRNGLVVGVAVVQATGTAERDAGLKLLAAHRRRGNKRRWTVAADKAYDTSGFVEGCRQLKITPQVAQNIHARRRRSAIDGRTTGRPGYATSQRVRKRVEEIFGWVKTVGGGRKLRYIGTRRNQLWAELTASAYNLVRMAKLCPKAA